MRQSAARGCAHQLYAGMPSEGMAGVRMANAESFSARLTAVGSGTLKEKAVDGRGKGSGRSRKRQWKDEERQ